MRDYSQVPFEFQVYPQSYMRSESLLLRSDIVSIGAGHCLDEYSGQVDYCIFLNIYNIY